jgi:class 3 adenylate cyclase
VVAERRVVSVLFVDLVGFTTASEARDAEDTRELLTRYFEIARTTITRYGGIVEKFIGDAVMAVWGAPVAKEDDAERACVPPSSWPRRSPHSMQACGRGRECSRARPL